jgi:hypothetical protein
MIHLSLFTSGTGDDSQRKEAKSQEPPSSLLVTGGLGKRSQIQELESHSLGSEAVQAYLRRAVMGSNLLSEEI